MERVAMLWFWFVQNETTHQLTTSICMAPNLHHIRDVELLLLHQIQTSCHLQVLQKQSKSRAPFMK